MLHEKTLTVNAVGDTLDFINLQWARNAGTSRRLKSGRVYCLLPFDTSRGKVYIIKFGDVVGVLPLRAYCWEELIGLAD